MDETTLFLGPDPDIMRHHQIAPRTAHESYCMTSDTDPIEADRIRKRLAGALDEAFEMCESMGAAPGAKMGGSLRRRLHSRRATSATSPTAASSPSPLCCTTRSATSWKNWKDEPTVGIRPGDGFLPQRFPVRNGAQHRPIDAGTRHARRPDHRLGRGHHPRRRKRCLRARRNAVRLRNPLRRRAARLTDQDRRRRATAPRSVDVPPAFDT